jgi:hypothetical protein
VGSSKKEQSTDGLVQPAARRAILPYILGGVGVFIVFIGVVVYLKRDSLFPPPAIPVPIVTEKPKPVVQIPETPTDITATSTNPQSVSIAWNDTATNELSYRIERAEGEGSFQSLTSLSSNSTSFQDASVSPEKKYRYRIVAMNEAGESPLSSEVSVNVPARPPQAPEGPKLPPAGLDTDSDGLSDLEEMLFGTDKRVPDTDSDGFLDGNEVFHLYNPGGRAPGKLIEADLVKEERGILPWVMDIPNGWSMKQTDPKGSSAVIGTDRAETFTISIEENPTNLSIVDWYLAKYPTIQESQLLHYRSKKGYEGIIGADLLTTYILWGNRVFVFTYDLNAQPFINYRTTYSMMLNSLQLTGLPETLPPMTGTPLPFEPAATTTGVVTQPEPLTSLPLNERQSATTTP